MKNSFYIKIKRAFDFIGALILIIFLLPIFFLISIVIKIDSPGPIIFKQKRIGKNNLEFSIYKFRTMYINTPSEVATHQLESPQKWITRFGRFLRKSSLDEIPQLFNILKADMSFVGPRPALWNQYELIKGRTDISVNLLRPGLTGLAQISGRDKLAIEEKIAFDKKYLDEISLRTDINIFLKTICYVLSLKGIVEGKNNQN